MTLYGIQFKCSTADPHSVQSFRRRHLYGHTDQCHNGIFLETAIVTSDHDMLSSLQHNSLLSTIVQLSET